MIMSHYSYKSCDDVGELFRTMFPDSAVAQKFTFGERLARVLQVSMNGPNVNWAFYDMLQNQTADEYNCQLLNLGFCGLHLVHGAFKHGYNAST